MTIAVLGASGKTGRHLVARLVADGHQVVAVGRSAERLARFIGTDVERRVAAFEDGTLLRAALVNIRIVVNTAEARFADALLAALPSSCRRVVQMGTMRRFLAEPDEPGLFAARAEKIVANCGVPALVIHPGMIYGHDDDQNVERVLAVMRRWPRALPMVLPLPDGGRHMVQPIFIDDLVDALVAAVTRPDAPGAPIAAPGPALSYAEMMKLCATVAGRRLRLINVPGDCFAHGGARGAARGLASPFRHGSARPRGRGQVSERRSAGAATGRRAAPFFGRTASQTGAPRMKR